MTENDLYQYMKKPGRILFMTGTLVVWVAILCFVPLRSCVKFDPPGFLYLSTDTINVESGAKGIYEFTGSIVNIGEEKITQHGFCWDENQMPYTSSSVTALGETNSKGAFTSTIEGLKVLSSYHMRAYVITSKGTFYGEEKTFVTSELSIPTVHTAKVIHINKNSAVCGGDIIDEGKSPVTSRGVCWGTLQKPTVADQMTSDGQGPDSFTSSIEDLALNTFYYVRAYAINLEGTAYGEEVSFKTWAEGEFSDYDENVYPTVVIGEQTWMKKNLRVTRYADGTPINEIVTDWVSLSHESKAYCWYNNDSSSYADPYGALYTWSAAMNGVVSSDQNPSEVQGVCPYGWHLPSDQEWQEMEISLGMDPGEADTLGLRERGEGLGGWLKGVGYLHWRNPNTGASNVSGFTAVAGGYRSVSGSFRSLKRSANFWTSTEFNPTNALDRRLNYSNSYINRGYTSLANGASVRCVKDD